MKTDKLPFFAKHNFISITYLAFKSIENVIPCCSSNLIFSLISVLSFLFSSHVPLPSFLEDTLKFVELHHAFLKHDWLQDIKLRDSNCLTTYPVRPLFCRVMKYPEWDVKSSLAGKAQLYMVPWKRTTNIARLASICIANENQAKGICWSNDNTICWWWYGAAIGPFSLINIRIL